MEMNWMASLIIIMLVSRSAVACKLMRVYKLALSGLIFFVEILTANLAGYHLDDWTLIALLASANATSELCFTIAPTAWKLLSPYVIKEDIDIDPELGLSTPLQRSLSAPAAADCATARPPTRLDSQTLWHQWRQASVYSATSTGSRE